ncbi:MAG TPA: GHMP kinase [bacterium]|nr:GHMP kinase [bacterium]HNT66332.1 GHMP kinase [bacterium]HOX87256.1 GHMP kinase [bacterium]HPG46717.1 GHMP kinase [bacterium]HPM98751.1 GHMP kinase [bacterium]
MIQTRAYARAGLAGNPSDGYFGKTLSVTLKNFYATVDLQESRKLKIVPNISDLCVFANIEELAHNVTERGYYGGLRLIQAAIKIFYRHCQDQGIELDNKNFAIRYNSNIPLQVGLAGSSAIVTAVMRALMAFYQIDIAKPLLANLILRAETEELGIAAGLQDRVVQVYEGLVFMDFNRELMQSRGFGKYEPLDPVSMPPLYLAYATELAEISGVPHSNLRQRYQAGEPQVHEAMKVFADCAQQARDALVEGKPELLGAIMDRNFDQRRQIMPITAHNLALVDGARAAGASAKFTGSGGAIIGTYKDNKMLHKLRASLEPLNAVVVKAEPYFPGIHK